MNIKRNLKTGFAIAAFWLLPNAGFCQDLNDAGIPSAIESSPPPFTGFGAPPTTSAPYTGSKPFRRNAPLNSFGNGPPNSFGKGPPPMGPPNWNGSPPSMGGPPPSLVNGPPQAMGNGPPPAMGVGNSGTTTANTGPDKAAPLQLQVTRLESTVFGHSSDNVPLMSRVANLEGKIFGTTYDTANKSLEDRVDHLWQAVNPQAPATDSNNQSPLAAITAFLSPIAESAQNFLRIQRPPDQQGDSGSGPAGMDMGANPPMGINPDGSPMRPNDPIGANVPMGPNPNGGQMASLPPPSNFSLGVPTNLFSSPAPSNIAAGPPVPYLNAGVLEFVRRNMGQQVGNGECWTLADQALKFAGAEPAQEYTFGRALGKNENWMPGDIIQFTSCIFKSKDGNRTNILKAGAPNHTAIMWGRDNGIPVMASQNNSGNKTVILMNIDLDSLIKGRFQIFRPIPMGPP